MKKQIMLTLLSTMVLGVSSGSVVSNQLVKADTTTESSSEAPTNQEDIVNIPDNNLRNDIQRALGADVPLTATNLLKLEKLNLTYSGVTDLTGLEAAKNLTWLDLTGNAISDIKPLSALSKLSYVNLRMNKATSLPDLGLLKGTAIRELNLVGDDYGQQLDKLAGVSELTTLENLELQNTKITTVPDLTKLTNLRSLGMAGNKLTEVSALKNLTNLTELAINSNQITDFTPISNLTNLERLLVGNNRSSDISSLKGLTKLKKANFSQMGLTNESMAIFTGMKQLETLAIDFNDQISDLSSLSELTNLTDLDFSKDNVTSLAPLAKLTKLESLGFSNNNVSDISALQGATALKTITMLRNHVMDLSPLNKLANLERVNAKFQSVDLASMTLNNQNGLDKIPAVVKSRKATTLPISLQSEGTLQMVDGGVTVTGLNTDKDGIVYMAWDTDSQDAAVKFTGTIAQPYQLKRETDKPAQKQTAVKISVLKGDGSNGTSVASNFIQTDAIVEEQNGKHSLLIKVIVPKNYGADSLNFKDGVKVSTTLVGETYVIAYRFDVDADALAGTPFLENMHVNINPEVLNYNHTYDVYFKIHGFKTNEDKAPEDNQTKPTPDETTPNKPTPNKPTPNKPTPPVKPDTPKAGQGSNDKAREGEYTAQFLKLGTNQRSVMADYMLERSHVTFVGNDAIIRIYANSPASANMITKLTLAGQTMRRDGNAYVVTLPKSVLTSVILGHVDVDVPGIIQESQPFSLRLLADGDSNNPVVPESTDATPGSEQQKVWTPKSNQAVTENGQGNNDNMPLVLQPNVTEMANGNKPVAMAMTNPVRALNAGTANGNAKDDQGTAENKQPAQDKQNKQAKQVSDVNNRLTSPLAATADANDKKTNSEMDTIFLIVGGIIAALLGYIAITLGWLIFKG